MGAAPGGVPEQPRGRGGSSAPEERAIEQSQADLDFEAALGDAFGGAPDAASMARPPRVISKTPKRFKAMKHTRIVMTMMNLESPNCAPQLTNFPPMTSAARMRNETTTPAP